MYRINVPHHLSQISLWNSTLQRLCIVLPTSPRPSKRAPTLNSHHLLSKTPGFIRGSGIRNWRNVMQRMNSNKQYICKKRPKLCLNVDSINPKHHPTINPTNHHRVANKQYNIPAGANVCLSVASGSIHPTNHHCLVTVSSVTGYECQ